jgi:hypothetical protein
MVESGRYSISTALSVWGQRNATLSSGTGGADKTAPSRPRTRER